LEGTQDEMVTTVIGKLGRTEGIAEQLDPTGTVPTGSLIGGRKGKFFCSIIGIEGRKEK